MKKYIYFVSYNYTDEVGIAGHGNAELFSNKKIKYIKQISEAAADLEKYLLKSDKKLKDPNVVILNYILMRRQ